MEHLLCLVSRDAVSLLVPVLGLTLGGYCLWRGTRRVRNADNQGGEPVPLDGFARLQVAQVRFFFGRKMAERVQERWAARRAGWSDGLTWLLAGSLIIVLAIERIWLIVARSGGC